MKVVVCKDAGSANLMAEDIKKNKDYIFFLKEPAKSIFEKKNIKSHNLKLLKKYIAKSNLLIAGTSWPLDIDYRSIKFAKKYNVKVITYLDHWVNYIERFNNNKLMLPNILITTDKYSYALARKKFPKIKIIKRKNKYLNKLKLEYKKIKKENKYILYIDNHLVDIKKNIINDKKYFKYDEKTIFKNFYFKIKKTKYKSKKILFRIHPKKTKKNALQVIKGHETSCVFSKNTSLIKDIAKSQIVVGWNSMAMYLAHKLKKKVMHILPKGIKSNVLPIKNIIYLNNEK